jgi:hypothetical protein
MDLSRLTLAPPAAPEVLEMIPEAFRPNFAPGYLDFMARHNGAEGYVGPSAYLILWSLERLPDLNEQYEVDRWASGLFIFGSNQWDTVYAFDFSDTPATIVETPFVGLSHEYKTTVAATFEELLEGLAAQGDPRQPATARYPQDHEFWKAHPIVLGGDPNNTSDIQLMPRDTHIAVVRKWNEMFDYAKKNAPRPKGRERS